MQSKDSGDILEKCISSRPLASHLPCSPCGCWALAGRKEVQEECTLGTKKLGHKRISQALPSAEFRMIIFYSSKHHYRRNGKKNKIYIHSRRIWITIYLCIWVVFHSSKIYLHRMKIENSKKFIYGLSNWPQFIVSSTENVLSWILWLLLQKQFHIIYEEDSKMQFSLKVTKSF